MAADILIVEDDVFQAKKMASMLSKLGHKVVGQVTSYQDAIEFLSKSYVDLVMLDIILDEDEAEVLDGGGCGKKNGIDVAKWIDEQHNIAYIFITANPQYFEEALKETRLSHFIEKPYESNEIYRVIKLSLRNRIYIAGYYEIKFRFKWTLRNPEKIPLINILYIESHKRDKIIHYKTGNKRDVVEKNQSWEEFEKKLEEAFQKFNANLEEYRYPFVRIHEGFLINLFWVEPQNLTSKSVLLNIGLKDLKTIRFGRTYLQDKELFGKISKKMEAIQNWKQVTE